MSDVYIISYILAQSLNKLLLFVGINNVSYVESNVNVRQQRRVEELKKGAGYWYDR